MSKRTTKYPVELIYRDVTIILEDESRAVQWTYLDEEGEPKTKRYATPSEVKAAIDRKLDAVVKKKFDRVKVWSFDRPGVVYEVTSIKKASYGGPTMRGTVVEAVGGKKSDYNFPTVGSTDRLTLERYTEFYFVEGNEELRAKLIEQDAVIAKLQAERAANKAGKKTTAEFFEKRGDFNDD